MNPLPRDGVGFCFFLLKFSRKSTHLMGEKTSSENESFDFKKKFFLKSKQKKYFQKFHFQRMFSPPWGWSFFCRI